MSTLTERVLQLAVKIQQISAPTFDEARRAEFVRGQFAAEGLADVQIDAAGNVMARLPGTGGAAPLVVSAHLDTVFPLDTDLSVIHQSDRIIGAGIGDNSLGVAGLFGLVWALRQQGTSLPGDVWLVGNTGEEGLGDLRGMRAVVEHFGGDVTAYLILEGMALGHVYHRALGVQRYRITARTSGGHSWTDFGRPSAIHELSAFVTGLSALKLPAEPRTTLNVGRIVGGTSVNTIAAEACLELDLRSESPKALEVLVRRVEEMIQALNRPGVSMQAEVIGRRPSGEIPASHPLVRLAVSCLAEKGLSANLTIGSTDANIPLSLGHPAVCIGLTSGSGAHTTNEFIHTGPLAAGLASLTETVFGIFKNVSR
jgi:acetylornithine deacetylase/succinyl-diaminopimelate desuccinylase-like protein